MPAAKGKRKSPQDRFSNSLQSSPVPALLPPVNHSDLAAIHAQATVAARAGIGRTFKKGNIGNIKPNHLFYYRTRRIFQDAAPEIAQAAIELALNTKTDERVRAVLFVAILDRAGLKPVDYDPNANTPQPSWDPGALSADERDQLKAILTKIA